ncbi:hypothetical protein [Sphingomonas montanisoli]|uniref:Flagellar assembly protein FliH/Type III secretion system HrpE domain-containing protein n=1 Tax=Sphingomonas montanisoli TaxID=2606412 RepID=A0A5D9C4X5_9SPHN|nr:hypothetical protein [Sphingomonas montanisoli]TZG25081.1 hypothetical protein FYJ91_17625 [Sphingomonas montanisoli]
MSDLWHPELSAGATRTEPWARPSIGGGFTPWTERAGAGRRSTDQGFVATDRRTSTRETEPQPAPAPDVEQMVADAFAAGFDQGREVVMAEFAAERQALAALMRATETLQAEPAAPLAAILAETVSRFVKQVVGEVQVDIETLQERAISLAELITAESGPARLRLHPDDIDRLQGLDLPLPTAPDHHLMPGSIVLESGEGWIEDGPQVRLAKLRTQLDNMGLPR